MKNSKFTETQIVAILQEVDAGMETKEVYRKHGISSPIYYKWLAACSRYCEYVWLCSSRTFLSSFST